jgi:hypothetical protein
MTHSVNAPFPPPTATQNIDPPSSESSTKDTAQQEAANVKDTAVQAGSQVASTATDQAKEVARETRRQAQDLLDQGRSQVREQAVGQQQKAAQGLSSFAQELRGLATGSSEGAPGPARDLLEQASGTVEDLSTWLQTHEPAEILDEVRRFARRKPGMFLLGAAVAGVVAGRLTSGVKAAHSDSSDARNRPLPAGRTADNYVDPAPAYTGYTGTAAPTGTTAGAPLPPPPYGTVPPAGTTVPPTTPAGWDDPARRPGEVL